MDSDTIKKDSHKSLRRGTQVYRIRQKQLNPTVPFNGGLILRNFFFFIFSRPPFPHLSNGWYLCHIVMVRIKQGYSYQELNKMYSVNNNNNNIGGNVDF